MAHHARARGLPGGPTATRHRDRPGPRPSPRRRVRPSGLRAVAGGHRGTPDRWGRWHRDARCDGSDRPALQAGSRGPACPDRCAGHHGGSDRTSGRPRAGRRSQVHLGRPRVNARRHQAARVPGGRPLPGGAGSRRCAAGAAQPGVPPGGAAASARPGAAPAPGRGARPAEAAARRGPTRRGAMSAEVAAPDACRDRPGRRHPRPGRGPAGCRVHHGGTRHPTASRRSPGAAPPDARRPGH